MTQVFNKTKHKNLRRMLRKSMPKAEIILWSNLRRKQLLDQRFRRQYGIGSYVIDFYCPKLKLAIEVDGDTHTDETIPYDNDRQEFIESYGVRFLRFTNEDIYENLDGVLTTIFETIQSLQRGTDSL
ncbi:MAG: endonuclease domain-containing protein [Ignavibacteriales bacterium]|nr:endonuclease domain-containing protein [Ignavibacteriales bacterium]